MKKTGLQIYPKVVHSFKKEKIYVDLSAVETTSDATVSIRIQPMEKYGTPHTAFRIDECDRYPYVEMTHEGGGVYSVEHDFIDEQRYSVCVDTGAAKPIKTYLYAVDDDYAALRAYKGDTHLHTNRSDGEGYPFEVACAYRSAGFDFIAVTDHHKMSPSEEARDAIGALTSAFTVFTGEEVHNKGMGYIHVINFGGKRSVNTVIETDGDYVSRRLDEIEASTDFPHGVDTHACAFKIFIADEIRRGGGVAILAHPFWETYGEYNAQTEDTKFLLKGGYFDAFELLGDCDHTGNGNNLQAALWSELRAEGVQTSIVGASDAHSTTHKTSYFNKSFSIVLANDVSAVPVSIKNGLSVAVSRRTDKDFYCIGSFRAVKYVRFLMEEYYPEYELLTGVHAEWLERGRQSGITDELRAAEASIDAFNSKFFSL